jgi:orotate phosphoribosyltransferase-like protein
MKYPKLPRKYDLRFKLTEADIKRIQALRKQGITIKKLSEIFKVSVTTIGYYIYPKMRKAIMEKNRKRRWKNPNYNKNKRRIRNIQYKKHRKYLTELMYKRRHKKSN